jgi:hypothetical protein
MSRTHERAWEPLNPALHDGGPDTAGRSARAWEGSEQIGDFQSPVGEAPAHLRRFGFQPLVTVVRLNDREHSRLITGGSLLQVHPSSGLKRFRYQLSLFGCQFFGFGLVTWIHSTHVSKP